MAHNKALSERLHNGHLRHDLLQTIYYEAKRAGLEPDLVLAVIRVESNFRKYAISSAGARGFMQVMPAWANIIVGETSSNLFNLRTNLRLGCAILRSYLDQERGNLHRALARYNGSLGKDDYPNLIYAAWRLTAAMLATCPRKTNSTRDNKMKKIQSPYYHVKKPP